MKFRSSLRRSFVALLVGVLIGGGLMAITPAGAQVNQAVSSKWKQIWKKQIRPQADKRYYTKKQGDTKYATKAEVSSGYQPKGNYEIAGSGYAKSETYSKAESDAKYAGTGSAYTKADSDAKYLAQPKTVRGVFSMRSTAAAAGSLVSNPVMFGVNLAEAPQVHYVADGAVPPTECAGGTSEAPKAQPGHLCVFASDAQNLSSPRIANAVGTFYTASPFGAYLSGQSAASGDVRWFGSWALGVSTLAAAGASVPPAESQGAVDGR